MAILKKNAESTGRPFDDEVLEYIATNIKSNIRELEGAINKIMAYSRLNKTDLNLDTAREALKDIVDPNGGSEVTADQILHTVCDHYGIKTTAVTSRNRSAEFVVPRQVIMYLCRSYLDMPLKEVAKLLGKKDHSTVIYGVDKIKSDIHQNEELRQNVDIILKKLNIQP
jgi:chromosomal replication initiator protein